MNRSILTLGILGSSFLAASAFSQTGAPNEWASFRGANHDGSVAMPGSVRDWGKVKLKKVWKEDTPAGFSSFAVAGGKVFTIVKGETDGNPGEAVLCLDARNGKKQWEQSITIINKYDGGGDSGTPENKGGDGPRSTPVVDGGMVYCIDANLGVHCLDAASGKIVWQRDVLKDNAGVMIKWQNAASPLIDGDVLLLAGGGAGQGLLGLNKKTGEVIWKGQDDKMTHASPILTTLLGTKQAIFFTQSGLVSVNPQDGSVYWRQAYPFKVSTAASPVVWEDIVYCSAGYGVGAGAFKISKAGSEWKSEQIWRKEGDDLANHWSTPVVKDGYLYGMFSFKKYGAGPLACVDIRTGELKWAEPNFGPGQVILSGDSVIATSDKGEIVIAAANPEKYKEQARSDVMDGKVWSYPVLAYDHIYARSTVEGVCLELK